MHVTSAREPETADGQSAAVRVDAGRRQRVGAAGQCGNAGRNASHAAAPRSVARAANRRPTSCTRIGRPLEVVVHGTLIAGWPDMLNGTVNAMCSRARAGSPAGLGSSAANAATGATGE